MNEQDFKNIDAILGQDTCKVELDIFRQAIAANGEATLFPEVEILIESVETRKCSKAVKELRKNIIRKLMVAALPKRTIIEYCCLKFRVKEKQIYKYFAEIHKEFEQAAVMDARVNYSLALARLEDLYFECRVLSDRKTAVNVLKEIDEIQGLKKQKDDGSNDEKIILHIDGGFIPDVCNQNNQSESTA